MLMTLFKDYIETFLKYKTNIQKVLYIYKTLNTNKKMFRYNYYQQVEYEK